MSCTLGYILSYLQLLVDRGLAYSTIKVYTAAISSCQEGFGGRSAFSQPLMARSPPPRSGTCRWCSRLWSQNHLSLWSAPP